MFKMYKLLILVTISVLAGSLDVVFAYHDVSRFKAYSVFIVLTLIICGLMDWCAN